MGRGSGSPYGEVSEPVGWQDGFDSGWDGKPKGMHWRTYKRLVAELEDFEHASNVNFYNYFGQRFGGLIDE